MIDQQVLDRARAAVRSRGGDALRAVLDESGLGDELALVRAFAEIGPRQQQPDAPMDDAEMASRLYEPEQPPRRFPRGDIADHGTQCRRLYPDLPRE